MSLNEPLRLNGGRKSDLEIGESDSYGQTGNSGYSAYSPSSSSFLFSPKFYKFGFIIAATLCLILVIAVVGLSLRGKTDDSPAVVPPSAQSSSSAPMPAPYLTSMTAPGSMTSNPRVMMSSSSSSSWTGMGIPYPQQANGRVLNAIGADMDFSRDLTADPCDDFYRYACGGWVAKTPLTGNTSRITKGFLLAGEDNTVAIRQVLNEDWPIITPFFQSCMDITTIEALGQSPIANLLMRLDPKNPAMTNLSDALMVIGEMKHNMNLDLMITYAVRANTSNPRQPVLYLTVGGVTTLASTNNGWRSYVGPTNRSDLIQSAISSVLQGFGVAAADAMTQAADIFNFEAGIVRIVNRVAIAASNLTSGEEAVISVDEAIKMTLDGEGLGAANGIFGLDELQQLAPNVPFTPYWNAVGLPAILKQYNINPPVYLADNQSFALLSDFIAKTPYTAILAYARWQGLNASIPYLWDGIRETHMKAFLTPLEGITALPDRYPYCSSMIVNGMPDLFGRYFQVRRLPEAVKATARDMITWIKQAFERNLPTISWMDDATRLVAAEKAYAILELVGGPENETWTDYSNMLIRRTTLWANYFQMQGQRSTQTLLLLTKPITRRNFGMNPSIVNAQYSSTANSMVFPAGILQAPFFSFDYPMAMNLGGIGMVMGHEMIHGFDNNGRQYDKDGIRQQWWDSAVIANFVNKTQCLINQYNNITVQGSRISGTRTQGENIADNGGLHMAFLAYQWYKDQLANIGLTDPVPPSANPLTSDQLFYYAHAQTWCTVATDAAIASQVLTDSHSPGEARVWAPLVNQDGFAQAFNCPVGSKMNPGPAKCDLY